MTKNELEVHNKFLLKQNELVRRRNIKLIYRGDSLANLCEKLNVDYNGSSTNIKVILERLFMVGEKSKRYFRNLEGFTIDETDDYVFEKIVDYFKDSIRNNNNKVKAFFDKNKDLKNFFSTKQNKNKFIKILDTINSRDKLAIRNYYLILIHRLSAINYRDKSNFISSTTDYSIAKKFSGHKVDKTDQIILHCWQPLTHEKYMTQKFGLPTYNSLPFSYQKEITLIGGIFPHFISGIEVAKTNNFYPNPNIFKEEITNETFLYGLNINQRDFDSIARLTNYSMTITNDGINTWENDTRR